MASVPYTCFPIAPHSRFDPQPFRVLILRRLWLPLPPIARNCRCGLPLDSCGHHRAACAAAGVLVRRGFAVESAAARICREAGTRVSLDVRVQDMDLARLDALDNRRLEIVADGLPLFQGAQLEVDTTLVSALRRDGVPHSLAENHIGAVQDPELTGQFGRIRLVVLAGEVAGRWSEESRDFLSQLAKAKARREPRHLRTRARQWATLLACSASKAFALSLLEHKEGPGVDGVTPPTTAVISDHRHLFSLCRDERVVLFLSFRGLIFLLGFSSKKWRLVVWPIQCWSICVVLCRVVGVGMSVCVVVCWCVFCCVLVVSCGCDCRVEDRDP